jgi:hypothetical protein
MAHGSQHGFLDCSSVPLARRDWYATASHHAPPPPSIYLPRASSWRHQSPTITKYQCNGWKIEPKKAYTCRHQHGRDFSMSIYTQTYLLQINSCTKQLLYSVRYLWNTDNYYMSTTEQLWHESTIRNYQKKVMDYWTRNLKNKITEPPNCILIFSNSYTFFCNNLWDLMGPYD